MGDVVPFVSRPRAATNKMILDRMHGAPMQSGTPQSSADPRNLNVVGAFNPAAWMFGVVLFAALLAIR